MMISILLNIDIALCDEEDYNDYITSIKKIQAFEQTTIDKVATNKVNNNSIVISLKH